MLSETFIAATSSSPQATSANSALLKDAGIFVHSFQPQPALRSTFKKSLTTANCLAVSSNYIFAAQSEKAVVHVYNREKGNHTATVPFPDGITSIALACDQTVLVLGTASGTIVLWEICTGRLFSTPASHLQAVNVLAVDLKSNFILSGSLDSNILVWSLLDLLSFPSTSSIPTDESFQPRYRLSDHHSAINAVVLGHSATPANFAVSASEDQTAIIWNYQSGERLRTFLLPSTPLCLALDPADRSFYAGYKDGSVQLIPFYDPTSNSSVHDISHASTPIQPPSFTRHFPSPSDSDSVSAEESDPTLSMSVSYDGTTLISGHASGKINSWSITPYKSSTSILAEYTGSPITAIQFQPLEGWPNESVPPFRLSTIVKPKPYESFSGSKGQFNGAYTFSAQFPSVIYNPRKKRRRASGMAAFEEALASPLFPSDMLAAGVSELSGMSSASNSAGGVADGEAIKGGQDFISLGDQNNKDGAGQAENEERIAHLEKQISHLQNLQRISHKHVADLAKENEELRRRDDEVTRRGAQKMRQHAKGNVADGVIDPGGGEQMDVDKNDHGNIESGNSRPLEEDSDGGAEGLINVKAAIELVNGNLPDED